MSQFYSQIIDHTEVPSPSQYLLILHLKPSLLGLSFGFNPVDAGDRSLLGRDVVTTPPFVGPCCNSVAAQFTAQPRDTNLLIYALSRYTTEHRSCTAQPLICKRKLFLGCHATDSGRAEKLRLVHDLMPCDTQVSTDVTG